MGLVDDLGLKVGRANSFQRLQQRLASTKVMSSFYGLVLDPIDSALFRLSRGRVTVPEVMAGMPVAMLTTTGRRSGEARTNPVAVIPRGEAVAVIGTNYGRTSTPAWVVNLEAHPDAELSHGEVVVPVRAERIPDEQIDALIDEAAAVYSGFPEYRRRITGRRLRAFELTARNGSPAA